MRLAVLATVTALALAPAAPADIRAPHIGDVAVSNGGARYKGDRRLLATISPNGDGYRDVALILFRLDEHASVTVVIAAVGFGAKKVYDRTFGLGPGHHVIRWRPRAWIQPRTYVVRVTARDRHGNVRRYGFARDVRAPVIRVLGIEATFMQESYAPSTEAELMLESDQRELTLQIFHVDGEDVLTNANDAMNGKPVTEPTPIQRSDRLDRPRLLRVWIGDWPTGLYFAKLKGSDGRSGYAPFIVRPRRLGEHRVAIVLPTYTWQAYNFRDGNGDGYGDTWYAGRTRRTLLARPYMARGVPPFFRSYDLGFFVWLARSERAGKERGADFLGDSDLDRVRTTVDLARSYDLLVFPGHHEYVTRREYLHVWRFRDRGGNLMFLSANNFFCRVDRRGRTLTRVNLWRRLGRPEAALLGVQYFASDRGARQGPFVVRANRHASWFLDGTGLVPGSKFGRFGIELDRKTRASPRSIDVLAEIPNLFGRGKTAQMTYYETRKSARVFSAGAFTLAGTARFEPVARLLNNLWERMARP